MSISATIEKQHGLRAKLVDLENRRVLVARIENSIEADDEYARVNCAGYGRIRRYSTFKLHFDQTITSKQPLGWARSKDGTYETQVFQLAGCDFRCWYCFVDDALLRADKNRANWFSAEELLNLALEEFVTPAVIDLSGGQPELVPEFTFWMMEAVEKKGLRGKLAIWSDDNLSSDFFWTFLNADQRKYVANFPGYTRTVCIKGFDAAGFTANTGAPEFLFERQLQLLQRLVDEGFRLEIYLTMLDIPRPSDQAAAAIDSLLVRLASIHPSLPSRVVPLKIHPFGNMLGRATGRRLSTLGVQVERFKLWRSRLAQPVA